MLSTVGDDVPPPLVALPPPSPSSTSISPRELPASPRLAKKTLLRPLTAATFDPARFLSRRVLKADDPPLSAPLKPQADSESFHIDAFPEALRATLSLFDEDGDHHISGSELYHAAQMYADSKKSNKRLRKMLMVLSIAMAFVFAAVFGLVYAVVILTKESTLQRGGVQTSKSDSSTPVTVNQLSWVKSVSLTAEMWDSQLDAVKHVTIAAGRSRLRAEVLGWARTEGGNVTFGTIFGEVTVLADGSMYSSSAEVHALLGVPDMGAPMGVFGSGRRLAAADGGGSASVAMACPPGHARDASFACAACAPDSVSPSGHACEACPSGTSTLGASQSTACSWCPEGLPCGGGRDACPPGSASLNGDGRFPCAPCAPGSFAPSAGAPACKPCPAGSYAALPGAAACDRCAAGTFSARTGADSAGACFACPEGAVATVEGRAACSMCRPGQQPGPQRDACLDCPVNSYSRSGLACAPCRGLTSTQGRTGSEKCV